MRGRRVARTAFVSVLVLLTPALGAQQRSSITLGLAKPEKPRVADLDTLKQWIAAVDAHEPGDFDRPARSIRSLSDDQVAGVVADLQALFEIYRKLLGEYRTSEKAAVSVGGAINKVTTNNVSFKAADKAQLTLKGLNEILGVVSEREWLARFNEILRRGTLLHTDIAFLGAPVPLYEVHDRSRDSTGSVVLQGQDGAFSLMRSPLSHLSAGRLLLDAIDPDPSADPAVAAWYYATAAVLEGESAMGDAFPLLTRAIQIFPQDSRILFYTGVLHEAQANDAFQGIAVTARARDYQSIVRTPKEELQQALNLFRAAAELDPRSSEIRLHLGRVTGLLGDHRSALRDLAAARVGLDEPSLQYDAALFEATEHEALGAWDAARADLTRAFELYPDAQSVLVGLSRLQFRAGDLAGAVAPLDKLFGKRPDDPARDDPWWTYFISHARNADQLVDEARLALARSIR